MRDNAAIPLRVVFRYFGGLAGGSERVLTGGGIWCDGAGGVFRRGGPERGLAGDMNVAPTGATEVPTGRIRINVSLSHFQIKENQK